MFVSFFVLLLGGISAVHVRRVAVGVGFLMVMVRLEVMPHAFNACLFMIATCVLSMLRLVLVLSALLHHPFDDLLSDSIGQVNKSQRLRPLVAHVLQDPVHPDVILTACIDKEVAILDLLDVHRRGLVGMNFLARRQEHCDICLCIVPRDRAGKIIRRKDRGDDPDPPVVLL